MVAEGERAAGEPLLRAVSLRKVFGDVVAVAGVDLEVVKGIQAIMGPNGSGKSTLLAMAAGALRPTSGMIYVCGYNLWGSPREQVEARKRLGYAPQEGLLRRDLSGYENLVWIGLLRGVGYFEASRRARELLELLGLWEHRGRAVSKYSGGMRKRLIVASALIHDPEILILDEPGSGLDPKALEDLWGILIKALKGRALIYSTHISAEAERFSDRVYIMYRGSIVASGAPQDLIKAHAPKPRVAVWIPEGARPLNVEGLSIVRVERGFASYEAEDPREGVRAVVEAYARASIEVLRVEVRSPGLDEVFLKLTGSPLEGGGGG